MLAVASAALAGCFDESGVVGSATVAGHYALTTVNGAGLPWTTSNTGSTKVEVLADTLHLYQGGTYAETGSTRMTVNGTATVAPIAKTGSYGFVGTSITFSPNGSAVYLAQYSNATISVVEANVTRVYVK